MCLLRKLLMLVSVSVASISCIAADVNFEYVESPMLNCSANNITENWVPGTTLYPMEVFYGDTNHHYVFGTLSTSVKIWDPLRLLDFKGPFQWYSSGKPIGTKEVVAFQNYYGVLVSSKAKTGQRAQLVYTLSRKYSTASTGGKAFNLVWTDVIDYRNRNSMVDAVWSDETRVTTDCVNIVIADVPLATNMKKPEVVAPKDLIFN